MNILVIDVGGTHVKILASGEKVKREIDSWPTLTPFISPPRFSKGIIASMGCPGDGIERQTARRWLAI